MAALLPKPQRWLRPQLVFVVLLAVFGSLFLALLRPLSTPDEGTHFLRAYEVASGQTFIADQAGLIRVPKSVAAFYAQGKCYSNDQPNIYVHRLTCDLPKLAATPLNAADSVPIPASKTHNYSPLGYLPQVLAILVLKPFNSSPLMMDYLGRVLVLLLYGALIFLAIRLSPVRKWALAFVGLLPMMIQQAVGLSPDVMSIAPAVLCLAIILRSLYEERSPWQMRWDFIWIGLLTSLAIQAKPTAAAVLLLVPLYRCGSGLAARLTVLRESSAAGSGGADLPRPVESTVKTVRHRRPLLLPKSLAIGLPLVLYVIWYLLSAHVDAFNGRLSVSVYIQQHLELLSHHPIESIGRFFSDSWAFLVRQQAAYQSFIGVFRWLDSSLTPQVLLGGLVLVGLVLLIGYRERREPLAGLSAGRLRLVGGTLVVSALVCLVGVFLIMWLTWTPLAAHSLEGVQGRYYLLPTFILAAVPRRRSRLVPQWAFAAVSVAGVVVLLVKSVRVLLLP